MYSAKTIDELYEEVKDYDYVLCSDAPLTTALNNRLDKAQLGPFAITPMQFASWKAVEFTGVPIIDDIRLVKKVADDTGYGIRYVHGEIERFRAALRYTREPRMGKKSRNVWEAFLQYNTVEKVLLTIDSAAEEFFRNSKVAVVGVEFFNELDKHIISPRYDIIEIFKDNEEFSIPSVRILGNDRQIAECAADIADRCGYNDVAIVMDTSGPIADNVKSALYRGEMPFINNLNVKDIGSVRNFLEFIDLALSFSTIKVKDVRELLSAYGGRIFSKYDKYYLSKFRDSGILRTDRTGELLDIMSDIGSFTFSEVCTRCIPSKDRSSVSMLLEQMECSGEYVSQHLLDDLVYAVNNIPDLNHNEQLSDNERKGVLLVDCKNSVYIDRPVIVYTGMCNEWAIDLGNVDYIDPKKIPDIEDTNATRFKALIQQGSVRFYFVNATKEGKDAIPCRYFDECMRLGVNEAGSKNIEPVSSFRQICTDEPIIGTWKVNKKDRTEAAGTVNVEGQEMPDSISNSSYMSYLNCPRQYMLSKLAGGADNSSTYTGERIHDYAEFRASYPDIAKENGPEYYAKMIADECASLYSPDLDSIERTKIASAVRAIDMFIDELGVEPGELIDRSREKKTANMFMAHHGLQKVSEHTERQFTSRDLAMNGVMDLVWNGIIYDYKTGKPKTAKDLAQEFDISDILEGKRIKDVKSCQPLFYLCLLEEFGEDHKDRFDLFFARQMYDQLLSGNDPDADACVRTVVVAKDREELIRTHLSDFFDSVKAYQGISPMDVYRLCQEASGDDPRLWPDTAGIDEFVASRLGLVGKRGTVTETTKKTAMGAVKKLSKVLTPQFVEAHGMLIVLRSTIDEFKQRLKKDLETLKRCYVTNFEAKPAIYCDKCEFRDVCTAEPKDGGECDE